MKRKLVVITGQDILAESNIDYPPRVPDEERDNPEFEIEELASYLRRVYKDYEPNAAHKAIAELEEKFDVTVITTCLDTFQEQAGSKCVIHLFGTIAETLPDGNPAPERLIYLDEHKDKELLSRARKAVKEADFCIAASCTPSMYPFDMLLQEIKPEAELAVCYHREGNHGLPRIRNVITAFKTSIYAPVSDGIESAAKGFEISIK